MPSTAIAATGMDSMQYYVGTWSCSGGGIGETPSSATVKYTLDSGVLREWVLVPAQGRMTRPYALNIAIVYDAKNNRYVETGLDNGSTWWVSYAAPFDGNTERWTDHATSSGTLGRGQNVRVDRNTFNTLGFKTIDAAKPDFKVTCHRSS